MVERNIIENVVPSVISEGLAANPKLDNVRTKIVNFMKQDVRYQVSNLNSKKCLEIDLDFSALGNIHGEFDWNSDGYQLPDRFALCRSHSIKKFQIL